MTNFIPVDGVKFILSDKDDVRSIRVSEWLEQMQQLPLSDDSCFPWDADLHHIFTSIGNGIWYESSNRHLIWFLFRKGFENYLKY